MPPAVFIRPCEWPGHNAKPKDCTDGCSKSSPKTSFQGDQTELNRGRSSEDPNHTHDLPSQDTSIAKYRTAVRENRKSRGGSHAYLSAIQT